MKKGSCIIRVDASASIGNGHLSRCLLVGKYIEDKGWLVHFLTAENESKIIIEQEGFLCNKIGSETINFLKYLKPIVVIADINSEKIFSSSKDYKNYLSILSKQCDILITFEDMVDNPYPADIVIIPYCGAEKLITKSKCKKTKYLLGPDFFPLRDEFKKIKTKISKKVETIIVTMGGSDPQKITLKVLRSLNEIRAKSEICVVIGNLSEISNKEIKDATLDIEGNVKIKRNVSNMSQLISEADVAITNSGLTKYEISSIGVPIILISNTEQQAKYSEMFFSKGSSINLGYYASVSEAEISSAYNKLIKNYKARYNMSKNGKLIVDGNGIERIFNAISKMTMDYKF